MSTSDDFPDDLIDAALSADVRPHDTAPLREAVLSQTVGVIRFRRRMRKCILAASLAGCYVAGLATMALRTPAEHGVSPPPVVASASPAPSSPPNRKIGPAQAEPRGDCAA